jgi:hypothetical protein
VKFRVPLKWFFTSFGVGIIAAIALGVLAFAAAHFFDAVGLYIAPARLIVPVLGPVIPSTLTYWLFPDGGAVAGVFFVLTSAVLFWTICFGAIHFAWAASRRRRDTSANSR